MDPSSKLEQTNFPGHGDSALKPAEQQAFRHGQTITQAFKRCCRKIRVSRKDSNFKQKGSLQAHQRWEGRCIRGQQDGKGQQVTRPSSQRAIPVSIIRATDTVSIADYLSPDCWSILFPVSKEAELERQDTRVEMLSIGVRRTRASPRKFVT